MTGHYRATFMLFLALTLGIAIWYAVTGHRANSFVESQQLLAPGASSDDWFGESIDYDGLTLVVGARKANGVSPESGAAYVYEVDRLTGRYSPVARLDAPVGGSRSWYGFHVAVSGDTIAVGAPRHGPDDARIGKVYIYERDHRRAGVWSLATAIQPAGAAEGDWFGNALELNGDLLVVGSRYSDATGKDSGAVYVFQRDRGANNSWVEVETLTGSDTMAGDLFGNALALDNGRLAEYLGSE